MVLCILPNDPENFTKICACVFCNVVGWHYTIPTITLPLNGKNPLSRYWTVTTHLLSIGRADWLKLHYMFNACDAKSWQRELPVGFPVRNCALNVLFINIFSRCFARIESGCVTEAKHVLLVCYFVPFFAGKLRERFSNFSREKSNELTDQQDMFYYRTHPKFRKLIVLCLAMLNISWKSVHTYFS